MTAPPSRDRPLILDIGGEGRHPQAWNVNPSRCQTIGSERGKPIPRLIHARGDCIPLPDQCADILIVERMPLRRATLCEMQRVASPTAEIILRHARAHGRDPHRLALEFLHGTVERRIVTIGRNTLQETVIRLQPTLPSDPAGD